MKKALAILTLLAMSTFLLACGKKNIVHCDNCGTEIEVEASVTEDDWITLCDKCGEEANKEIMEAIWGTE